MMHPQPNKPGDVSLEPAEAFAAMTLFIHQFAARAGDDLLTLLGDISPWDETAGVPGPVTQDPAAWEDWLTCVARVKERGLTGPQPNPFEGQ